LLDWERGGYFSVSPAADARSEREYLPDSLILVTTFTSGSNSAQLVDFFAMRAGGRRHPRRRLVRILHGLRGRMRFDIAVVPRLDFGEVKPWIYSAGEQGHFAVGSNTGLLIFADMPLQIVSEHELRARVEVRAGERRHVALQFLPPEEAEQVHAPPQIGAELRSQFDETRRWWEEWARKSPYPDHSGVGIKRSAIVLKALTYAPTGAIVAAPTTSLPESIGGERNWDYRYCWIRDSIFTVRALSAMGLGAEAGGFRRFIQRSAAGNAEELQVLYGVDGNRRLTEICLDRLDGWRGSRPVRIGNAAESQFQADMYGTIMELSCRWSEQGYRPQRHYWKFLAEIVERAIARWREPDRGIWEVRSEPQHFVHSKVMCWAAVDGGLALARKHSLPAPTARWQKAREQMRREIEAHGIDHRRGIFLRAFGSHEVDAALLLLPSVEFVAYSDARMLRTTDVIRHDLTRDRGLIMRYVCSDGLQGSEGTFVACTFWLAECLAKQGRVAQARAVFQRACRCANDVGLFSEQYDARPRRLLGNFPQGLTHIAHVSAALALTAQLQAPQRRSTEPVDR
jgi:GH15 family glucan-1,4-alpha-glucosidase